MKTRDVLSMDDLNRDEQQAVDSIVKPKVTRKKWSKASAKVKQQPDTRKREPVHESRAQEAHAAAHRIWAQPWGRPGKFPQIPPQPGMVQRWIRVADIHGRADMGNSSSKQMEGWAPRLSSTLPKGYFAPTLDTGAYGGGIGIGGMVLMEMPVSLNQERKDWHKAKNDLQSESVNHQLALDSQHGIKGFGAIHKAERTDMGTLREVKAALDE